MPGGDLSGGMGGFPGKGGGMSPTMGGGGGYAEGFSGLGGMSGQGGYSPDGNASGLMGAGAEGAKAVEVLNAAMADPLLIEVHIGGLLTLYMTPEESVTQAKTEEIAAKEAEESTPASDVPGASDTPASGLDASAVGPPSDGSVPGQSLPDASVPDASAVGPPSVGSVPGQSLSTEGADPEPASDGTTAVPESDSVPPETSPPGTPSPQE